MLGSGAMQRALAAIGFVYANWYPSQNVWKDDARGGAPIGVDLQSITERCRAKKIGYEIISEPGEEWIRVRAWKMVGGEKLQVSQKRSTLMHDETQALVEVLSELWNNDPSGHAVPLSLPTGHQ